MADAQNLCGQSFDEYVLRTMLFETEKGTLYWGAHPSGAQALVRHSVFPDSNTYSRILAQNNGNTQATDGYFAQQVQILQQDLQKMNSITAQDNQYLLQVEKFEITRRADSYQYDIFVRAEAATPFKVYAKQQNLTLSDSVTLAKTLANGVQQLHDVGMLHGAIGESCVFVTRDGLFKVGAFRPAFENIPEIQSNLPPETLKSGQYDKQSEVYAVNALLYTLLNNNRMPYLQQASGNVQQALQMRMSDNPLPMAVHAAGQLGTVILRGLSGRAERYPAMSAYLEDLNEAVGALAKESLQKVVLLAGVGANAGVSEQAPVQPVQRPVQQPQAKQPKKKKTGLIITICAIATLLVAGIIAAAFFLLMPKEEEVIWYDIDVVTPEVTLDYGAVHEIVFISDTEVDYDQIQYTSKNTKVATVTDKGVIEAVGDGETVVKIVQAVNGQKKNIGEVRVKAVILDQEKIMEMLEADTTFADFGLYIADLSGDEVKEYTFDGLADEKMHISALVSVPILYRVGQDAEYYLDDEVEFKYTFPGRGLYGEEYEGDMFTIEELIEGMMWNSDNNCINTLIDWYGESGIEWVANDAGYTKTSIITPINGDPSVQNSSTAKELGKMFIELIEDETSLSGEYIIDNFQIDNETDSMAYYGMVSALPASDMKYSNHNAIADGKYNELLYVENGDTRFVIVFLSNNSESSNMKECANISKNIAKYVYKQLNNASK